MQYIFCFPYEVNNSYVYVGPHFDPINYIRLVKPLRVVHIQFFHCWSWLKQETFKYMWPRSVWSTQSLTLQDCILSTYSVWWLSQRTFHGSACLFQNTKF